MTESLNSNKNKTLTNEEIQMIKHLHYLRKESQYIQSHKDLTVTSEEFEQRFKERYKI